MDKMELLVEISIHIALAINIILCAVIMITILIGGPPIIYTTSLFFQMLALFLQQRLCESAIKKAQSNTKEK